MVLAVHGSFKSVGKLEWEYMVDDLQERVDDHGVLEAVRVVPLNSSLFSQFIL